MKNKFDPYITNPDNYKFGIIYYNTIDKRILVPKLNKYLGWTLNFGNHLTYLLLISIVAIVALYKMFV